jgi:citrate lyase beta subunit
MDESLRTGEHEAWRARLAATQEAFERTFPGESPERQPVHTVYGGAHLFRADTAGRLAEKALATFDAYAPSATVLAEALGIPATEDLSRRLHERVRAKLVREAVEDFRIDFEDGYGSRPDAEEDQCAVDAAHEAAAGATQGSLPAFLGIRIKPLSRELGRRSLRTLDLFVTTLVKANDGALPANFVVTLPKVVDDAQVRVLVEALTTLETRLGLAAGLLRLELMIETTQSILDADGRCPLVRWVRAAEGRCVAAHFGVYDYTASCSITANHQRMGHAACHHARAVMQVALAGTGVWLSDGATNVLPVPPQRAASGASLSPSQEAENRAVVHAAWKRHYDDVRTSLERGYYQGWDLHPAQLPTRYAALYAFFLEGMASASERLANFVDKAAQATLVGDVFDDAATGQGLLNFFLRGVNCGAIREEEALVTGLSMSELRSRSFSKILAGRRVHRS